MATKETVTQTMNVYLVFTSGCCICKSRVKGTTELQIPKWIRCQKKWWWWPRQQGNQIVASIDLNTQSPDLCSYMTVMLVSLESRSLQSVGSSWRHCCRLPKSLMGTVVPCGTWMYSGWKGSVAGLCGGVITEMWGFFSFF